MIEDISLDTFDDGEVYGEDGFSLDDDEQTYDSVTPSSRIDRQRRDLVRGKIRDLEKKFNTSIPPTEYDRFRLSGKELQFKKSDGQYVSLTNTRSGKFLESSGIRSRLGAGLARYLLGLKTPSQDKARATKVLDTLPTELEMDELTLEQQKKNNFCGYKHRPRHARVSLHRQDTDENQRRATIQRFKALSSRRAPKKEYYKLDEVQNDDRYKDLCKKIDPLSQR